MAQASREIQDKDLFALKQAELLQKMHEELE